MARALSVARVEVAAASEPEYLAGAAALAAVLAARGQHFWVFRHPDRPGAFLEFREAADRTAHLAEAGHLAALRTVAPADPDADVIWLEIPLAGARTPADGPA